MYNLRKKYRQQIIDTTINYYPNSGGILFQQYIVGCNDKLKLGKQQNFQDQQKQVHQLETQEQHPHHLLDQH